MEKFENTGALPGAILAMLIVEIVCFGGGYLIDEWRGAAIGSVLGGIGGGIRCAQIGFRWGQRV